MSTGTQILKPEKPITAPVPQELREKANKFLNSPKENIKLLDELLKKKINSSEQAVAILQTIEVVFKNLLIKGELSTLKRKKGSEPAYNVKLGNYYIQAWEIISQRLSQGETLEANVALHTSMTLLATEAQYPLKTNNKQQKQSIPQNRLLQVLAAIIDSSKQDDKHTQSLIEQFQRFTQFLDVLEATWFVLPSLATENNFKSNSYILNYLAVVNTLDMRKAVLDSAQYLNKKPQDKFDYENIRRQVSHVWDKTWKSITNSLEEQVHRQLLIVLIERIMPHMLNPISLTDFLMDSLDYGGAVSLLALQGIFVLIQKHNITYPDVYDKLYSMFEMNIFHTKFKARLFYLADIFLSSTHLPLNLVAAFAKRLARLSLLAPPQDAIIIVHFICNLIIRHTGLKRLITATAIEEFKSDPYDPTEKDPSKSNAIRSSLWELVVLQKHAIPTVATVARIVMKPLPMKEFDLAEFLEVKESDIFDEETKKQIKQFPLAFEAPEGLYLPKDDIIKTYWKLF